jgi:hypothetical protein
MFSKEENNGTLKTKFLNGIFKIESSYGFSFPATTIFKATAVLYTDFTI